MGMIYPTLRLKQLFLDQDDIFEINPTLFNYQASIIAELVDDR